MISSQTGISRRTVQRIAKFDLQLKVFRRREVQLLAHADRVKRLAACKLLSRRLTVAKLARTWFTDEKIFTVQTPTNSQNDRVYADVAVKRDIPSELLLKGRNSEALLTEHHGFGCRVAAGEIVISFR